MKNLLMLLLMACLMTTSLISCDNATQSLLDKVQASDSALIVSIIDAKTNPTFNSVEQIVVYRESVQKNAEEDSIFNVIPHEQFVEIATVVYKKYNCISKKLIVKEYKDNYNKVYKYLPKSEELQKLEETKTNKPSNDTTINGKVYTLKSEEK